MHTLLPLNSTVKPISWLVIVLLAILLHLALLLNYESPPHEPALKGVDIKVVEIGLKKLIAAPAPVKPKSELKKITKPVQKAVLNKPVKPPAKPKPTLKKPLKTTPKVKPVLVAKPSTQPPKPAKPKPTLKKPLKTPPKVKPVLVAKPSTNPPEKTLKENTEAIVKETTTQTAPETTKQVAASASKASSNGGNAKIKASYETRLLMWLQRYKRYPNTAKRRGQEDRVDIQFTIDAKGNVLSQRLVKPSSYSSLNKAVEKMLKRAAPLPSVPEEIQAGKTQFTFVVPVSFKLN
ncbi:energy transducer TonB [bacterium]|nr:energy transducer TonB [bacterium]